MGEFPGIQEEQLRWCWGGTAGSRDCQYYGVGNHFNAFSGMLNEHVPENQSSSLGSYTITLILYLLKIVMFCSSLILYINFDF